MRVVEFHAVNDENVKMAFNVEAISAVIKQNDKCTKIYTIPDTFVVGETYENVMREILEKREGEWRTEKEAGDGENGESRREIHIIV